MLNYAHLSQVYPLQSHWHRNWLPSLGRFQKALQRLQTAVDVCNLCAGIGIVVSSGRHPGPLLLPLLPLLLLLGLLNSSRRRLGGNEAACPACCCCTATAAATTGLLLASELLQPLPHLHQRSPWRGCTLLARQEAVPRCPCTGVVHCRRPQPLCAAHSSRPLPWVTLQWPAPPLATVPPCLPRTVSAGIAAGHPAALWRGVPCSMGGGSQQASCPQPAADSSMGLHQEMMPCSPSVTARCLQQASWHPTSSRLRHPHCHWHSLELGMEGRREAGRLPPKEPAGDCMRPARRVSSRRREASRSLSRFALTYSVGSKRLAEAGREGR